MVHGRIPKKSTLNKSKKQTPNVWKMPHKSPYVSYPIAYMGLVYLPTYMP